MKLGRYELKVVKTEKIENEIQQTEGETKVTKMTLKKKILLGVGALAVGTLGVIAWGKCNNSNSEQEDSNEDDRDEDDDDYDDEDDDDDSEESEDESTESKEESEE